MEMDVSKDTGLTVEVRVQNEGSKRKCRDHANVISGSESLFQNGEQALEDF